MKRKLLAIISSFFLFFLITIQVSAAASDGCQTLYGGGQSCIQAKEFNLNKTVKNPVSNDFVDNIDQKNTVFAPTQQIPFKITIRNTSGKTIKNITMKDVFPKYVDFEIGDGKYDANSRTYTFSIPALNPNETKVFFISGKAVAKDKLPTDKEVVCIVNQSSATANKAVSRDNSQFCISKTASLPKSNQSQQTQQKTPTPTNPPTTKGGLPVYQPKKSSTTPPTGPEALSVISLLPAAALGFWLRKKTQ